MTTQDFTGEYSGVYKTTDGGFNWIMSSIGAGTKIINIHFSDSLNGTLIDEPGRVLKTTNAGDNWFEYSEIPVFFSVSDVSFVNDDTIYASDFGIAETELFKSTNAGLNWSGRFICSNYIFRQSRVFC